jgi:molybdenum cofactor guanylyltransferase
VSVRQARAAGAVLSGGSSSRFGSDKTRAELGGSTLLDRVARALRDGGADPVVAVGGDEHPGIDTVPDLHPGQGPLGGVASALRWSDAPRTVVVAADLPMLDPLTVAALAARSDQVPAAVAVARSSQRLQPTCACWPAGSLDAVCGALAGGERSVSRFLAGFAIEPVDVPDRVVADVDTPEELAAVARWWSR